MKVRVVDFHYHGDGSPVVDETSKQPLRNGGAYFYGGTLYFPGEVIEMPDDIARAELAACGPSQDALGHAGRRAILEPQEDHEKRLKQQQAAVAAREDERKAIARRMTELEAQANQSAKLRAMVEERERALLAKEAEVSKARAEVPADFLDRLKKLEEEAERRAKEADDLKTMLRSRDEELAQAKAAAGRAQKKDKPEVAG